MSKIGKMPISIPDNVSISIIDDVLTAKGKLGELTVNILKQIKVEQTAQELTVTRIDDTKESRSLHGLIRSLINNSIQGVSVGYTKTLEINGVGFKAEVKGNRIVFSVGFSHPVELMIIEGVEIKQDKNQIIVSGIDKQKVGQMAAQIRAVKKPEPYKGKGIKYSDEIIRRKAGKAAKTAV